MRFKVPIQLTLHLFMSYHTPITNRVDNKYGILVGIVKTNVFV